jgi:hypothetical protein
LSKPKGFASNPDNINRNGRPKGAKSKSTINREIKNKIKEYSEEAVENIVDIMRFNKDQVERFLEEYLREKMLIEELDSLEEKAQREKNCVQLFKEITKFNDATGKYSIKILDYAYTLILNDDRLDISRQKLKIPDENVDTEDDGVPEVSLTSIKR